MTKEKVQNIKSSHQANLENQGSDNLQHGWEIKKLGEVCELSAGGDVPKDNFSETKTEKYSIPIYANGEKNEGLYGYTNIAKVSKPSITVSARGTIGFSVKRLEAFFPVVRLIVVTPINQKELDLDFLDYSLKRIDFKHSGSSIPQLTVPMIRDYEIPLPPLPEQQRIVSILDEAFAAIAKAKANAEQNLKNAKELFESYLQEVFEKKGDGWEKKKLGEVIEYDKNQNIHKGLPYVGLEHIESNSGRFIGSLEPQVVKSSTFYFNEQHVLYGRLRPYLNKVLLPNFEGHCSTEIFPIKVGKQIAREFLFYWLIAGSTVKKIDATWTGARMPRANMNQVLEFDFAFPTLKEQQTIVRQLDALRAETQKLEAIYQKKIDNLEELKKSILQKAFSGELSGREPVESITEN